MSLIETGKKKFAEFQLLDNGKVKKNEKTVTKPSKTLLKYVGATADEMVGDLEA